MYCLFDVFFNNLSTKSSKMNELSSGEDKSETSGDTLVLINGTIVSSKGFESFYSCICFYIESNKNWSFVLDSNNSSFYGTTQKSRTNNSDISLYSMPFEIALNYKNLNNSLVMGTTLFLKVLSFDYNNRLISESYGFVEIPIKRGKHTFVVNTWKPFIDNRLERMKQLFTGCVPNIQDLHLDSTQLTNKKCVNNYGIQLESSGSVELNFDLIIQREKPLLINKEKYRVKSSVNSIKQNVLSVVLAFQRAKRRMDGIRDELTQTNLFTVI